EQGAHRLGEAALVYPAGDLDVRQGIGRVHRDVAPRGLRRREVDARLPQALVERVAVVLGRDDEAGRVRAQPAPDVVVEGGDEGRVVVVELDDVLGGRRIRVRSVHGRLVQRATHVPGRSLRRT